MNTLKWIVFSILCLLLVSACGTAPASATLLPFTDTAAPSLTPLPPTPTQTPTPSPTTTPRLIAGTLKVQVNVRSGPGTSYDSLGLLNAGQKVDLLAQNADGTWYELLFPSAPTGVGWISAQFVDNGGQPVPTQTAQVTPTASGPSGTTGQRLNVRSGPGTSYETLGVLEPGTLVMLTGKNETGTWLQIIFPLGSTDTGWVTAAYLKVDDTAGLPVLDAHGTPVTPGTPAGTPVPGFTPTPTIGPAAADGDGSSAPLARVVFTAYGTHRFSFQGEVSAPQGDGEDWIEFTPYALPGTGDAVLIANLTCTGNSTLEVELWQAGTLLPNWGSLACGEEEKTFRLTPGTAYQFRLRPSHSAGAASLQYVSYDLILRNDP